MSNSAVPSLGDLVTKKIIPDDPVLLELLREASRREDAFIFAGHLVRRNVDYISPSCEKMLGYPQEVFVNGGAEFIFSLADAQSIPVIIETEMGHIKEAKQQGFDPGAVIIQRFEAKLRTAFGHSLKIVCLGVVMNYSEYGDMENGFAFQAIDNPETLAWCQAMLTKIKMRFNEVYDHPPFRYPIATQTVDEKNKPLTAREVDVLKLLAKGFTSVEIAEKLSIGENTVETHRKNMLLKFGARNVADMIAKASKIYWLE